MKIDEDVYLVGSGQIRLSNPMDSNVYLIDGGEKTVLVDSGVGIDTDTILRNIQKDGFNPESIAFLLLTHSHADHSGGAKWIKSKTGCRVMASELEAHIIQEGSERELGLDVAKRSGIYPKDYHFHHCEIDGILRDNDMLDIGDYKIKVILIGGHSPSSACFLLEGKGLHRLFSGDTVFFGGTIGLGNWFGSSLEAYRRDIVKLKGLGIDALFPGHYIWTLKGGQEFLDRAIENLQQAWVPPAWRHMHPLL